MITFLSAIDRAAITSEEQIKSNNLENEEKVIQYGVFQRQDRRHSPSCCCSVDVMFSFTHVLRCSGRYLSCGRGST